MNHDFLLLGRLLSPFYVYRELLGGRHNWVPDLQVQKAKFYLPLAFCAAKLDIDLPRETYTLWESYNL